ncbi:MAG: dynamin family protein [Nostocaceae cyanobacterium]|nr:dynamin family protein [Nostocaceae cyanobacterium]
MQRMNKNYQQLADALKSASQLLDLSAKSQLYKDVISIDNHLNNPNFRIAVFGPFNHGKSTLLNAILGNRTLPIDLIPTTGAAITVKYGSDLRTRIMLVDGTEIYRSGTDILKKFAILDGERRMRSDVVSVEVFCSHPLLDTGVEFIDLPGTNDREEQDNLVRDQLLSADLVVQLLDARKVMTLGERENLRDWLLNRGIKTVIFVANFINLLDPEEQKQVQNRLRFVAESFRADLPPAFSNLYRVDALPALRARLKGDVAAASASGLVAFETALQNIVEMFQKNPGSVRLPRVENIASQLQRSSKAHIDYLKGEIQEFDKKSKAKNDIKQRAQLLIKQGFSKSVADLRDWLDLRNLQNKYQTDAALALAQNNFKNWENTAFKKDLLDLQLAVSKWLEQAYEFFKAEKPTDLLIPFPSEPKVTLPNKVNNSKDLSEPGAIAVGGGIGWLLGGPVAAAVAASISYIVNKNVQQQDEKITTESYERQIAKICLDAVDDYLQHLHTQGLSILTEYEIKAGKVMEFQLPPEPLEIIKKRDKLQQLQSGLNKLNRELEKHLGISISSEYQIEIETPKRHNTQSVYRSSGTGFKEDVGTRRIGETPKVEEKGTTAEKDKRNVNVSPPKSETTSPPPPKNLEAKFRAWELDEEIARMKVDMGIPGGQTQKQQNTAKSHKQTNTPKTQVDKEKIHRAYTILGLKSDASPTEVKQAYRNYVKKYHPDLFVNQPQLLKKAEEKMRLVNEAYTLLCEKNN